MIYDKDDLDEKFKMVAEYFTVEDIIISMPKYMNSKNWKDEDREKLGFTKQPDGSWGKLETSMTLYNNFKQDVEDLYFTLKKVSQENETLRKKNYELEYACRFAAKSIEKYLK